MATTVDLNADVGEIPGDGDAALLPWLTSANIACGLHAGDPVRMQRTVALAIAHGVAIGAHPGWPDREGFGRRPIPDALPSDAQALVLYQLGALAAITQAAGQRVQHVKVHGALANQAARDPQLALAVGRAIALFDKRLRWLVMPGTELERAGQALGLPFPVVRVLPQQHHPHLRERCVPKRTHRLRRKNLRTGSNALIQKELQ